MRERLLKSCIVIFVSIGIINTQIRILRTIFPHHIATKHFFWYTVAMGGGVASLLLLFTYCIKPYVSHFPIDTRGYSIFIIGAGLIFSLILATKKQWIPAFFIASATSVATITGITELFFLGTGIGIILMKAAGEEILKTTSAHIIHDTSAVFRSDIILMSIIAARGFAFFENIVYFVIDHNVVSFIVRALTVSLFHAIFTGIIGYSIRKKQATGGIIHATFVYIFAYTGGIFLHGIYNRGIEKSPLLTALVFVIGGYILLSYLLYTSERLYIK